MTYPDPHVAAYLRDHFVPVRVDSAAQPRLAREHGVFWTPSLIAAHHSGIVVRQTIGYLPPRPMLGELLLMRGLYFLRTGKYAEADEALSNLAMAYPELEASHEAMYWRGVAVYRRTRDKENLWRIWLDLVGRYPESVWAAKTTLDPHDSGA